MSFVHLHLHTEYSLLDGITRIDRLFRKAHYYGMPAVALTDHGAMYGAVEFYQEALQWGIKPILGCEIYFTAGRMTDRERENKNHHFTLLAKNLAGYRNLVKLTSLAHLEGFYYKPRVDWETLVKYHNGLIILTGCEQSVICQNILKGDVAKARQWLGHLMDVFGDDVYIEVQNHGRPTQAKLNAALVQFSKDTGRPLVATNDVHYLNKQDAALQDVVICIQTKALVSQADRMKMDTQEYYVKSPAEMAALFAEIPDAVRNTLAIAEKCEDYLQLKDVKPKFPAFQPPEPFPSPEAYFDHLCSEGFKQKYAPDREDAKKRLEYEMGIIQSKGFTTYFLVIQDFIAHAKATGVPVGPGRGSVVSSVVAYCLGITELDPLKYNLLFERFLNPERKSLPDVDVDFCQNRRDEVIRYVRNKYGQKSVSQIVTFGRMMSRAAIRDVGRVLSMNLPLVDTVAKTVPFNTRIADAFKSPDFMKLYRSSPELKRVISFALRAEGLVRTTSIHAGGVVIGEGDLSDHVPLKTAKEGEVLTQYPMEGLEALGFVKMDFLGLRNLTLIRHAIELIHKHHGVTLDLLKIPLDDKKTFQVFQAGDTTGIFQFESEVARRLCRDVHPEAFGEIIAINAMNRPGPLNSGMAGQYIRRKHGKERVSYLHPDLKPFLVETYGVFLYQEQVMQIAVQLAGFTPGESDDLRKAMGKKDAAVMARTLERFAAGCQRNGIPQAIARKILEAMSEFAQYGFNKSHSAAYGLLAYQTAYLRSHYPVEFFMALLTSVIGNTDKTAEYLTEAKQKGLHILHPDINKSYGDFALERLESGDPALRVGLCTIKGVGANAAASLVAARDTGGAFTSLGDFCSRVDLHLLNKGVLESLIKAGAFDRMHGNRAAMMDAVPAGIEAASRSARVAEAGASLFGEADAPSHVLNLSLADIPDFDTATRLQMEKEVLGMFISGHPLEKYRGPLRALPAIPIPRLRDAPDSERVGLLGYVSQFTLRTSKKGNRYAQGVIEDPGGTVEFRVFRDLDVFSDMGPLRIGYFEGRIQRDLYEEESEDRKPNITLLIDKARFDRGKPVEEAPAADLPEAIADLPEDNGAPSDFVAEAPVEPRATEPSSGETRDLASLQEEREVKPAGTNGGRFRVIIPAPEISQVRLRQLQKAIAAHPGAAPLALVVRNRGQDEVIELPDSQRVSPEPLATALQSLGFSIELP